MTRTTRALSRALVTLLEERAFDRIAVQDILDRAGVGRTAFYAHYRNKHDVLASSYDGMFASFETLLDRSPPYGLQGPRLFPVAELLAHVGDMRRLVRAMERDGLLDDAWTLLTGHAAAIIHRRLARWVDAPQASAASSATARVRGGTLGGSSRPLLARMLAGALVESTRWWQDHPMVATPAEMDTAFHELARGVLQHTRGGTAPPAAVQQVGHRGAAPRRPTRAGPRRTGAPRRVGRNVSSSVCR